MLNWYHFFVLKIKLFIKLSSFQNKAIEDEKRKSESKKHVENEENGDSEEEEVSQSEDDVSDSKQKIHLM